MYSGTYKADQALNNARTERGGRSGGMTLMQGNKSTPTTEAVAGDIVAVSKIEDLHIGDTVSTLGASAEAAGAGLSDAIVRPGGSAEGARRRAEDFRQPGEDLK